MTDRPDITEHVEVLRRSLEADGGWALGTEELQAIRAIVAAYPKPITFTHEQIQRVRQWLPVTTDTARAYLQRANEAGMVEVDDDGRKVIVL